MIVSEPISRSNSSPERQRYPPRCARWEHTPAGTAVASATSFQPPALIAPEAASPAVALPIPDAVPGVPAQTTPTSWHGSVLLALCAHAPPMRHTRRTNAWCRLVFRVVLPDSVVSSIRLSQPGSSTLLLLLATPMIKSVFAAGGGSNRRRPTQPIDILDISSLFGPCVTQ